MISREWNLMKLYLKQLKPYLFLMDEAHQATGYIVVGDEMLTPDSSRFWPADQYEPGHGQPSFDKQFARDWLKSDANTADPENWELPQDIVDKTIDKYLSAYEMLTGEKL